MKEVQMPLVSIVITSYNRGAWIKEALISALAQDYENLEIIISDNCSTDNTDEIIRPYLVDPRIKFSKNETNIGMLPNFEKAFFELAKGDYILNLCSDDYLNDSTFISKAIAIIEKYENIALVFGRYQFLLESTHSVKESQLAPDYYLTEFRTGKQAFLDFADNPYFGWGGCLINRKTFISTETHFLGNMYGDVEINLKLMMYGNCGYVNVNTYTVRMHDANETGKYFTAHQQIEHHLKMFDNSARLFEHTYGNDEALQRWRETILQRCIVHVSHAFLVSDKKEFKIFIDYVRINYPQYYRKLMRSPRFFINRHLLVLFIKNKILRKIAAILFPGKKYFDKGYKYVY